MKKQVFLFRLLNITGNGQVKYILKQIMQQMNESQIQMEQMVIMHNDTQKQMFLTQNPEINMDIWFKQDIHQG